MGSNKDSRLETEILLMLRQRPMLLLHNTVKLVWKRNTYLNNKDSFVNQKPRAVLLL